MFLTCRAHGVTLLQVFRAYDLKSGTEVALKIHTVETNVPMGQREYVRRAIREVAILEGLHHPAIVRLHEVFQIGDNSLAIVMEACRGAQCAVYCVVRDCIRSWQMCMLGRTAFKRVCLHCHACLALCLSCQAHHVAHALWHCGHRP